MAKDVGILFADISGSTRLYQTLGTEEAKHQVERCVKRMERSIGSYKGTVVGPTADEIVATFPTADDTVQAALDMQRRIADLPPVSGVRLSIRIGVHYGSFDPNQSEQSGSAAEIGRALLKLAGAGQIVTCALAAGSLTKAQQECLLPIGDMVLSTPLGDCQLFEVKERGAQPSFRPTGTTTPAADSAERLFVRHAGTAYVIDNAVPTMTFGRDKEANFVLHGSKASRHHAVIEKRGRTGFVLIDRSTNGTYLKIDGSPEQRVVDGEAIISGRGKLGFGHPTDTEGDSAEFELA